MLELFIYLIIYIYGGYAFLVYFISIFWKNNTSVVRPVKDDKLPNVTVFLSALNEEGVIEKRLKNLIESDYPEHKYEIIVVSDGSTDRTVELINSFSELIDAPPIRCISFKENQGPAAAQNIVVKYSESEILISTDAQTQFYPDTIRRLLEPFTDSSIGVTGGRICYQHNQESVGKAYGMYRNMEDIMRNAESNLNIGVKVDGPLCAFRKCIWEPIKDYEDVDQVVTMLAKKKNYYSVHVSKAKAIDDANSSYGQELKQRTRMTRKSWLSLFNQWSIRNSVRYPLFTIALLSHKYLRFLSPLFLFGLVFSLFFKLLEHGVLFEFASFLLLFILVIVIAFPVRKLKNILGMIRAFLVANYAFLKGGWLALRGVKDGKYTPTKKL